MHYFLLSLYYNQSKNNKITNKQTIVSQLIEYKIEHKKYDMGLLSFMNNWWRFILTSDVHVMLMQEY